MRRDDELERPAGAPIEGEASRSASEGEAPRNASEGEAPVPQPGPEEVPELLGERSDYPMPRGDPR